MLIATFKYEARLKLDFEYEQNEIVKPRVWMSNFPGFYLPDQVWDLVYRGNVCYMREIHDHGQWDMLQIESANITMMPHPSALQFRYRSMRRYLQPRIIQVAGAARTTNDYHLQYI